MRSNYLSRYWIDRFARERVSLILLSAAALLLHGCFGASDQGSSVITLVDAVAVDTAGQGDGTNAAEAGSGDAIGSGDASDDVSGSDSEVGDSQGSDSSGADASGTDAIGDGIDCSDGAPCDDGDACTDGDSCKAGVCVPGPPRVCTGNECSIASCDPQIGCVFQDLTTPCDDGSLCTTDDTCANAICHGKAVNCDDGNECTVDSCEVTQGCVTTLQIDDVPCGNKAVCYKGACVATGTIFAHTSSELFRLELKSKSFVKVGAFQFDKNSGSVTDIAIDRTDKLYAITFGDLFVCKPSDAKCVWVMSLPTSFNGMTFVHAGTIYPDQDALIGIANDGGWHHVQFNANPPKIVKLGSYGGYGSSGDAFSVKGIGTYATVTKFGTSSDLLVSVDPKTGKVLAEVGPTGVSGLWGVAWLDGSAYGFSSTGSVYTIDIQTGAAKSVTGVTVPSASWWGAGVSTEIGL